MSIGANFVVTVKYLMHIQACKHNCAVSIRNDAVWVALLNYRSTVIPALVMFPICQVKHFLHFNDLMNDLRLPMCSWDGSQFNSNNGQVIIVTEWSEIRDGLNIDRLG